MNFKNIGDFISNQGLAIIVSAILLLLFWHFGRDEKKYQPKREVVWTI